MFQSFASLKQQVMIGFCSNTALSARIRMETPAILLPFLDFVTDILVVLNFHAHVFFQLNFTFVALQNKPAHKRV